MADSIIRVMVKVDGIPGSEAELRNILLQFLKKHCQLGSCISCELVQSPVESTEFLIMEKWESEARLSYDFSNAEHVQEVFKKAANLLAGPISIKWYPDV